jgi:lactoylglutathione lyase
LLDPCQRRTLPAMAALLPALVLYAGNPAVTRRFYEVLGLTFREERHGDGPEHVACDMGGFVLEIYPRLASMFGRGPCRHVRLILPVESVRETVKVLEAHRVTVMPAITGDGLSARVTDPDGVPVLLLQR